MKRLIIFFALLSSIAFPAVAQAHFLWASFEAPGKVSVGLQEHPGDGALPLGERAVKVKAWSKVAKSISLKAEGNALKGSVAGDWVAVSLDYGVLDRREGGRGIYKLYYYAKAAANMAAAEKRVGLPVELSLVKGAAVVYQDGKVAAGAEVVVQGADGGTVFEGKTGADGKLALPSISGAIAIRCMVVKDGKGTDGGKAYDFVRSYCTLTVPGSGGAAKPVMTLLREAFGDNHEVVGHTAFIETLMAGKLTLPQLRAHLEQRALIHEEVDRVLSASKGLPYGAAQKSVMALLRSDLTAAGSSWPSKDQAWPLTRKLIDEIRANGPYFALGVQHVYYGGITNGGRIIGAKIVDTLKVEQSYYLKSEGYEEYVGRLSAITDPKDQREMVRGGVAAYRYIIETNDAELFKSRS